MSNLLITINPKHPDKFYVLTKKDVYSLGWETDKKFESYYMKMSPWNLVDLFQQRKNLGLDIEYDSCVESIRENLLSELNIYKNAYKYRTMDITTLNDEWESQGFPELFPHLIADEHQRRSTLWSLMVKKCGVYLEQGVGKTPVGILVLGKLLIDKQTKNPLVFAPLSSLSKTAWFKDLERFSEFKPINLRAGDDIGNTTGSVNFINYDTLQSWCFTKTEKAERSYYKENYFEIRKFDAIFYDESATLRNHTSYRSKAMMEICRHAKYLIFSSGVPAPNSVLQFYTQMYCIGSVLGDNALAFMNRYGKEKSIGPTTKFFPKPNAEQEIRKRIDLVSYFVTRKVALPDLPERLYHKVDIELHPEHMKLYNKVLKDYIAAISGFDENGNQLEGQILVEHEVTMYTKLLQIMDGFTKVKNDQDKSVHLSLPWNAKLEKLDEMINEFLQDPECNIIIWCRFRFEIETIYNKYKDKASYIYGAMADKKREECLVKWLEDKNCRIMVALPKAAKYNHTWLKANKTIYYSGTPDYDDYCQSQDRNYRRGQTRVIDEYKLIVKDTIERLVWYAISTRKKVDLFIKEYVMDNMRYIK